MPALTIAPFAMIILGLIAYSLVFPDQIEVAIAWLFEGPWLVLFIVAWVLSIFPINRMVDMRFRKLRPFKRRKNAV